MKTIVNILFFIGIVFWITFIFIDSFKILSLNGFGNHFHMCEPEISSIKIDTDSIDTIITYTYIVAGKKFDNKYEMYSEYYNKCNLDTLIIKYNETFPEISYIEGINLKTRQSCIGLGFSIFFLSILFLLWKLISKFYWVQKFEETGNRT